jgi:DNA-binding NarL/FixJ family response regulator
MPSVTQTVPVVAIINSHDDVVEMLRLAFEYAGFVVVSAHVDAIKRGETSLADFVREHRPEVIVYDLVPPYDRSYRFVEHLRQTDLLRDARFVLTSTNAARARELSGTSEEIHEILGKPYDIDELTRSVASAAAEARMSPPSHQKP